MARYNLVRDEAGLGLNDTYSTQRCLHADFSGTEFLTRLKQAGRKNELVARAVKIAVDRQVLDCTAGLGRDGFLLAHLGCRVTMIERSKVMHLLLEDALQRASTHPYLSGAVSRITLIHGDACSVLKRQQADVVYLDPMFPEKTSSAAVRGPMQLLQRFLGTDQDAAQLLADALGSGASRVVLKRPPKGAWQPPLPPTREIASRNACYEIYDR